MLQQHNSKGGLQLRSIEDMTMALVFRQAWRIQRNPASMLARKWIAKYGRNWFDQCLRGNKPTTRASYGVRSILGSVWSMRKGVRRTVGNGENIKVKEDWWVGKGKLDSNCLMGQFRVQEGIRLSELISQEREWKVNKVWNAFEKSLAKQVLAIHIPKEANEDGFEWFHSKNGDYSVKSGYWYRIKKIREQDRGMQSQEGMDVFWVKWWKRKIFPKWKIFVWKILNGCIPVRVNLRKRNIQVSAACPLCNKGEETQEHLFRDCEVAIRVWKESHLGIKASEGKYVGIK